MDYGREKFQRFVDEAGPKAPLSVAVRTLLQLVLFRGSHSSGDFLNLVFGITNLHGQFRCASVA
jgi:hypothetical protein